MTTEPGRQFVLSRMGDCPNIDALRRVWDSLGNEYKRDPIVRDFKDKLKEALSDD